MKAIFYGLYIQFKIDIRSKSLFITCYLVPLLFFAIMGGIFTALIPETENSLIASMIVMGVSMGALIGVPPAIAEIYGTDIKKMYQANGIPIYYGIVTLTISAFFHLMIMSLIIMLVAPIAFHSNVPSNLLLFLGTLSIFILVSLCISCVLGLAVKEQAKLTMISQLFFLPSIMLSGIMFPIDYLPEIFQNIGKIFPAAWGYKVLLQNRMDVISYIPFFVIGILSILIVYYLCMKNRLK